jgi:F-type H+-transporting ATPase subunit gamma
VSLKAIKGKIQSVTKTRKVTKAMEAVSAVKMRKSQERALSGRPYARTAIEILKRVAGSREAVQHVLAEERTTSGKVLLVVVSSDKGLCGALNANVFKAAHALIEEHGWQSEDLLVYAIGKKAQEHFSARGFTLYAHHPSPEESAALEDVEEITEEIIGGFLRQQYDRVHMVYTNFRSTFEQEPVTRRILPISFAALQETVNGIVPDKGKFADQVEAPAHVSTYTIEPSPESVLSTLIPRLVAVELYHGLIEGSASEHSARMVAMKNASDKAGEVSRELNLTYNKARQADITQEVSEIVGGMQVSS